MSRASKKANWGNNEKILLALYQDWGLDASLESKEGRQNSKSTYDVRINNESPVEFCSDAKLSDAGWRHHSLLEIIEKKYCRKPHQLGILFTRNTGKRWGAFTVRDSIFMGLISVFLGIKTREQVLEQWSIKTNSENSG